MPIINSFTRGRGQYWEPFVGSGKVIQSVKAEDRTGTDLDRPMIALLKAVQSGWNPPTVVTEDDYGLWMSRRKKLRYADDPMMGFVGYGCSFGARYFQGYARSKKGTVNFAESARAALLRQKPLLKDVYLFVDDYRQVMTGGRLNPRVMYCDPPYRGTKPVGSAVTRAFDSDEFWQWAVNWAAKGWIVLVSEYECPVKTASVLWESKVAAGIRFDTGGDGGATGSGRKKYEKLYCLSEGASKQVGLGLLP